MVLTWLGIKDKQDWGLCQVCELNSEKLTGGLGVQGDPEINPEGNITSEVLPYGGTRHNPYIPYLHIRTCPRPSTSYKMPPVSTIMFHFRSWPMATVALHSFMQTGRWVAQMARHFNQFKIHEGKFLSYGILEWG